MVTKVYLIGCSKQPPEPDLKEPRDITTELEAARTQLKQQFDPAIVVSGGGGGRGWLSGTLVNKGASQALTPVSYLTRTLNILRACTPRRRPALAILVLGHCRECT